MYLLYNHYVGTDFNKSSGIVNSKDEIANTRNHHYQVCQDSQSLKVANHSQSAEKLTVISTNIQSQLVKNSNHPSQGIQTS